jgi:hypothetical protein
MDGIKEGWRKGDLEALAREDLTTAHAFELLDHVENYMEGLSEFP